MSEDTKHKDAGPDEWRKLDRADPEDTEGHKKWETGTGSANPPDGGPDEARKKVLAIPDDDDTEGHKR